jgi:putative tryptophan/tyrosine transport system substrate-binding protein
MRRHAVGLIVPLVLGCLIVPLAVEAQPSAKVPRIGLLSPFSPANQGPTRVDTFRQGLQDLGYREGQNILIEYRWADGHPERLVELAADLVRL